MFSIPYLLYYLIFIEDVYTYFKDLSVIPQKKSGTQLNPGPIYEISCLDLLKLSKLHCNQYSFHGVIERSFSFLLMKAFTNALAIRALVSNGMLWSISQRRMR